MKKPLALSAQTFRLDVTPPIGGYVCGGLYGRSIGVESPLDLRGVLLDSAGQRCAIAVVDYCYLCGRSHRRMVEAIARGADLPVSHVSVHANHLHDAPLINEEVHAAIADAVPELHDEVYFSQVLERLEQTIVVARHQPATSIASISFSSAPVYEFASSRRILDKNNHCAVRWSVLFRDEDMYLKNAPEGKIDPMLDQVTFYDASGQPRICMSFYASHPQVSCGRGLWSADTIGVARELFEKANPGVFSLNFDGCGGDVTAGKYTTLNRHRNRLVFGLRLYDGMQAAFDRAAPEPLHQVGWNHHAFDMPLRQEEHDEAHYTAMVQDPQIDVPSKYLAGLKVFRLRDRIETYPFSIGRLSLNDYSILFMPAELFVEYQLYAKRRAPSKLTAAAYGDCFLNYVPTDEAFAQGGYEVLPAWTLVDPGCEGRIKEAIDAVLRMKAPA